MTSYAQNYKRPLQPKTARVRGGGTGSQGTMSNLPRLKQPSAYTNPVKKKPYQPVSPLTSSLQAGSAMPPNSAVPITSGAQTQPLTPSAPLTASLGSGMAGWKGGGASKVAQKPPGGMPGMDQGMGGVPGMPQMPDTGGMPGVGGATPPDMGMMPDMGVTQTQMPEMPQMPEMGGDIGQALMGATPSRGALSQQPKTTAGGGIPDNDWMTKFQQGVPGGQEQWGGTAYNQGLIPDAQPPARPPQPPEPPPEPVMPGSRMPTPEPVDMAQTLMGQPTPMGVAAQPSQAQPLGVSLPGGMTQAQAEGHMAAALRDPGIAAPTQQVQPPVQPLAGALGQPQAAAPPARAAYAAAPPARQRLRPPPKTGVSLLRAGRVAAQQRPVSACPSQPAFQG